MIAATLTNAQSLASVTSAASADLLVAMVLSENSSLNFGSSVLTDASGGTIELPSNSITRVYGGGVATSAASPAPTNASYSVSGNALQTYALVLPTSTTVTHTSISSGVFAMDITLMKARFNGATDDATVSTLSSDGTDSFTVGGTLTILPNQVGGEYTGTFQVSVDYN
tara:strand:+ start:5507 stop:6013 length:507 start_codon:yes stop_codon:yes gene_type:complete